MAVDRFGDASRVSGKRRGESLPVRRWLQLGAASAGIGVALVATPAGIAAADTDTGGSPADRSTASSHPVGDPGSGLAHTARRGAERQSSAARVAGTRSNAESDIPAIAVRPSRVATPDTDERPRPAKVAQSTARGSAVNPTEGIPTDSATAVAPPAVASTITAPINQSAATAAVAGPLKVVADVIDRFFDVAATWLGGLPANHFIDMFEGALLLVRRSPLFNWTITYNLNGCVASKNCSNTDLTGENLSGVDLRGVDFAGAQLAGAYFYGADLRDADLSGANLAGALLSGAQLLGARLVDADFSGADLHDANLAGAYLDRANFGGANLNHTNLTGIVGEPAITFAELDSPTSTIAVRVNSSQTMADAIKVDAGTTFTLTLPGPATEYTVMANKPGLVAISTSGNQLQFNATTPGFLGLKIQATNGSAERFVGLYIADPTTHVVPDTVEGYEPVGAVTVADDTGNQFLENFNFQDGVAPIDYLYIYDQGGADYTDGNLKGLLTQSLRYGTVPVVVYYNLQNVFTSAGQSTYVTEGPDSAYQSINDYNTAGQSNPQLYDQYMKRYFTKLGADFSTMNSLGVPVQVVMEPDFLGYMQTSTPSFQTSTFVPNTGDRTLNTANTAAIYDAGLLTAGVAPAFDNTVAGLVQAINYYTATKATNLRIGWKTNIWSVADQQNWSLGLLHMTDSTTYPWQGQWTRPAPTWDEGRTFIANQATGLGGFLKKVGVTSWVGSADRTPFLAIDKYGVDGAYTFDPGFLGTESGTAAFGNLNSFVQGAYQNLAGISDVDTQKYFGLSKTEFDAFYKKYNGTFPATQPDVQAVFTTLQNAAKADPNMALWFFNADQWNNYLLLVSSLSQALDGTKVMLWQIPQGHINGSTTLPGKDLTNTVANFEDSATSYFFGDSFTATDGRLDHFSENQAGDPGVTVAGSTITWGEHMTAAQQAGVMSVLFGAGLGISTRGTPTPGGAINDQDFWTDKAAGYLASVQSH